MPGCPGVDQNLGGGDGRSLPSLVAEVGCEDVLRMLNRANVDPNSVEGVGRQIPLSRATAGW